MLCEMCSTKQASVKADVEGAKLNVCEVCAKYGKIIGRVAPPVTRKSEKAAAAATPAKVTETVQIIVNDYDRIIRQAREKLGLTQEEFAKRILERESHMHKVESGHMKPDLTLARKLEKALKIRLVEQVEIESGASTEHKKSEGMTLGDLIKIK